MNRNTDAYYNDEVSSFYELPWLQDTVSNSVWQLWNVTYRDVIVLDPRNRSYAIYNLTEHDLGDPQNRAMLKQFFLEAARLVDEDSDGMLDHWEILQFGNLNASATEDPDNDGRDNFAEYTSGTDPNDPDSSSSFQTATMGAGTNRALTVSFSKRLGSTLNYQLEYSSQIVPWASAAQAIEVLEPVRNLFDGTGTARTTYVIPQIQNFSSGFIRVRAVPVVQP